MPPGPGRRGGPWFGALRFGSSWFGRYASNLADVLYVYWLPLYLLDRQGLGEHHAGWMAALPLVGGALGGVASGWLQSYFFRRTGNRRWARSGVGMAGKGLAAGLILISLGVESAAVAGLFLTVKFFCDWEQPAEWGTISDIAGRSSATVFACVNTVGSLGGFVAGPLIGAVLQAYSDGDKPTAAGWNAVFVLIAGEYLVAAACWLFIDCRKAIHPVPGPFH